MSSSVIMVNWWNLSSWNKSSTFRFFILILYCIKINSHFDMKIMNYHTNYECLTQRCILHIQHHDKFSWQWLLFSAIIFPSLSSIITMMNFHHNAEFWLHWYNCITMMNWFWSQFVIFTIMTNVITIMNFNINEEFSIKMINFYH